MGRLASLRTAQRLLALPNSQNLQSTLSRRCLCQPSSSSSAPSEATVSVQYELGLPLLTLPLPSRQEPCQFALRPLSDTVGTLCDNLQSEDKGLDYVAVYNTEGVRVSVSTSIEHLLQFGTFRLRLNDKYFDVQVPRHSKDVEMSSDRLRELDDIRATVASLHTVLCVDEYKLSREKQLILRLEQAEAELRPLQEHKVRIERECETSSNRVMWCGFAAMGIQTGIFAQLTWFEYSWDIMEPVTYFATYATVISTLGYYLYTKQPFDYPAAKERLFTKAFYKRAQKQNFNIERYNDLVTEVETLRGQLHRLRDPLFQHLPVSYLSRLGVELKKR